MENPFVFGKAAEGHCFTDRRDDTKRLMSNLTHGVNTILISPRRWGKTSLVKKVVREIGVTTPSVRVVFLDVFHCKDAKDFLQTFAVSIIKQTSSQVEEWVDMVKTFLSNLSPRISFGTDPATDFSISFDFNPKQGTEEMILSLPQQIAQKKNLRIVICIDEFQQVAEFPDNMTFQKRMRSVWQHQQLVTYCMFGSRKHLMGNIFNDKRAPFYKFADMMFLGKIPPEEWIPFICERYADSGKQITSAQAMRICELTECVSSYVQHLSWLVWYKSESSVKDEDIDNALGELMEQNKVFFQREIESLSPLQVNFLVALADGVKEGFSRKEIIERYGLESSPNIQSVKKALLKKELISVDGKEVSFDDSLFKLWLKRQRLVF